MWSKSNIDEYRESNIPWGEPPKKYKWKVQDCAHLRCPECGGSGRKKNGTTCVHMISCRCPRCSPSFLSLNPSSVSGRLL